jgi:hypothetical protein
VGAERFRAYALRLRALGGRADRRRGHGCSLSRTQAAFAAARAPSATAAQLYGQAAAAEAVLGSQIENLQVTIDTGSFQRGSTLTVTARGYVNLASFPIISQVLGGRVEVTWQAHALIEPYRSRTP